MEQESFLGSDELDDDVFYPDDFEFTIPPLTPPSPFIQNYTSFFGRFHLFPLSHCCGPGCRSADSEDKATQTLGSPSVSMDTMLPCGVTESPHRLFYGNAGYMLQHPVRSPSLLGDHLTRGRQEQSAERRIARKLQCIGDQFHRLHLQKALPDRRRVKRPDNSTGRPNGLQTLQRTITTRETAKNGGVWKRRIIQRAECDRQQ